MPPRSDGLLRARDLKPPPVIPTINCDLGEGEPLHATSTLMGLIDAANIACGGHAGSPESIAACLDLARRHQVRAGAHPGLPDRSGFGRSTPSSLAPADLVALLDDQVGRFIQAAGHADVPVSHIKLHGALYHLVDARPELGDAYLDAVKARWPRVAIMARDGGWVATRARSLGIRVIREGFLDRAYRPDGTLVPRGEPNAVLHQPEQVLERLRSLEQHGGWPAIDGSWLRLEPDSLCVHGDSQGATAMLQAIRALHPRRLTPVPGTG